MKKFKKAFRLLGLMLLILLALAGMGGIPSFSTREKHMDHQIRTEQVDKKEDESDGELKDIT